jgi:hypothetical protein
MVQTVDGTSGPFYALIDYVSMFQMALRTIKIIMFSYQEIIKKLRPNAVFQFVFTGPS